LKPPGADGSSSKLSATEADYPDGLIVVQFVALDLLIYVVRRKPGMERAMGIEPAGNAVPSLENKRFGENADAKYD
jgi:hypothetical protein